MRVQLKDLLQKRGKLIVDGAMATELEKMGLDLNDSLWSAKVLAEDPEKIIAVHESYFVAGADIGISASYQATIAGFMEKGYSKDQAESFIRRSVELLKTARDQWWEKEGKASGRPYPMAAAAVGPYGAYLADGSEYRGHYNVSRETLRTFHQQRMELLWEAGADILAIETLPSLEEAVLCATLAQEMGMACWISFSCKDEGHICEGTPVEECVRALEGIDAVQAVGLNCTAPHFVESLIKKMVSATTKPIVVYPNSGESYDAVTKTWHGSADGMTYGQYAALWDRAGASIIGGCCRTTPADIRQVYEYLHK
ncbi:MAG TPA: homocysteine S-methyltransferase [Firmicutes bacterium]|nr:homocysteine S-methyltransferase [Bacillota bacterium]